MVATSDLLWIAVKWRMKFDEVLSAIKAAAL